MVKCGKGFSSGAKRLARVWWGPASVRLEGGSGLESDVESDVVLLVITEQGARRLLSDGFPLGEVASGPVGRSAAAFTGAQKPAEILAWSRSQGALPGLPLQSATPPPALTTHPALHPHLPATP